MRRGTRIVLVQAVLGCEDQLQIPCTWGPKMITQFVVWQKALASKCHICHAQKSKTEKRAFFDFGVDMCSFTLGRAHERPMPAAMRRGTRIVLVQAVLGSTWHICHAQIENREMRIL